MSQDADAQSPRESNDGCLLKSDSVDSDAEGVVGPSQELYKLIQAKLGKGFCILYSCHCAFLRTQGCADHSQPTHGLSRP